MRIKDEYIKYSLNISGENAMKRLSGNRMSPKNKLNIKIVKLNCKMAFLIG
jgi:hypothetical protein